MFSLLRRETEKKTHINLRFRVQCPQPELKESLFSCLTLSMDNFRKSMTEPFALLDIEQCGEGPSRCFRIGSSLSTARRMNLAGAATPESRSLVAHYHLGFGTMYPNWSPNMSFSCAGQGMHQLHCASLLRCFRLVRKFFLPQMPPSPTQCWRFSCIWLTAGVLLTILKLQEVALVATFLRPLPLDIQNSMDSGRSFLRDSSRHEIELSCGARHVNNARTVEATLTSALAATMALCCVVFTTSCADTGDRQSAERWCDDSIQVDGVITLLLIFSTILLRLRSLLVVPVLLAFLIINVAIRLAPRAAAHCVQYFSSSTIVISLQAILSVAGAVMSESRSRFAFEALFRHYDECLEFEEVRARKRSTCPFEVSDRRNPSRSLGEHRRYLGGGWLHSCVLPLHYPEEFLTSVESASTTADLRHCSSIQQWC